MTQRFIPRHSYWMPRVLKALVQLKGEARANNITNRAVEGSRKPNHQGAHAANIALRNCRMRGWVERPNEAMERGQPTTHYRYRITPDGRRALLLWGAQQQEDGDG